MYDDDKQESVYDSNKQPLVEWVTTRCENWRTYRDANYRSKWEEYERMWRGIWSAEDKTRDTERSRVIVPAAQQALETHVAEISEAVFGYGEFFDIDDNQLDQQKEDVYQVKRQLMEDFKVDGVRKKVDDVIFNGGLYGTGIAEIIVKDTKSVRPTMQPIEGTDLAAVGVQISKRLSVYPKPVHPKNFLIDPNATSIEDALGCAVEEPVSIHIIKKGMEDGIYEECDLQNSAYKSELASLEEESPYQDDFVYLMKYYGLVPKALLDKATSVDGEEVVDLFDDEEEGEYDSEFSNLVEALVVIANGKLLKATPNPYMMEDRPIVAYQDDTVPNKFYGRGVMEKAYNMQKALDAQMRSHLDSLALTTAPMMGIDASRLPRGMKFEVRPGKSILTNGNPNEVLMPFKFGQDGTGNIAQAKEFERLLLMATGTLDASGMPTAMSRDGTASGMSMALSALIKKNKRSLVNFQEQFLIPMIKKIAVRYMQFDPERYPAMDVEFVPTSSLGIMAREMEQQQFVGLLQTMGADTPITPLLLQGIVAHSSLSNREELLAKLNEMANRQPDPMQEQLQQVTIQLEIEKKKAEIAEMQSKAQLNSVKAAIEPEKAKAALIGAISQNLAEDTEDKTFEQRARIADLLLKERDIKTRESIVEAQTKRNVDTEV